MMKFLLENKKFIGIGGCVLTIIGCYLPFASALGMTVNYIDGDGKAVLILSIITGILLYFNKEKASLIPTTLACLVFLSAIIKYLGGEVSGVNIGIGFVFILIGVIAQLVCPFLKKEETGGK